MAKVLVNGICSISPYMNQAMVIESVAFEIVAIPSAAYGRFLSFNLLGPRQSAGAGFLLAALWLLRYDLAWNGLGQSGLSRYIAACLLAGFIRVGGRRNSMDSFRAVLQRRSVI